MADCSISIRQIWSLDITITSIATISSSNVITSFEATARVATCIVSCIALHTASRIASRIAASLLSTTAEPTTEPTTGLPCAGAAGDGAPP